ncbi:sensor histidine kinase [Evansella sp. AB-rgal1]|uniref:sensor histidine kinase n=1 Tax=Evansella sp. AB-rgal1 TaxID=3242696 RepID=UPI00359CBEAC
MVTFWIWLLLLGVSWLFALLDYSSSPFHMPLRLVGTAAFFSLFFLAPLFRKKQRSLCVLLCIVVMVTIITLWPEKQGNPNMFSLIIFSVIAGKAVFRLRPIQASVVGLFLCFGLLAPYFFKYPSFPIQFILLYASLLVVALVAYYKTMTRESDFAIRNEALLSEYRKMKRRIVEDEKLARQEERAQIGRDIHDSVGHKLTALLLQLEVFRMKTDPSLQSNVIELKKLAKDSLEETRSAVKALRQDEASGLSSIIRLIRKLEAESYVRVQFTVKHGALSAPLGNEQAIAVYRAVQEALTNMMRHSGRKDVDIIFEAPAGGIFRFEVSNQIKEDIRYREGFGLSSMRERLKRAKGTCDILQYNGRFIVRGTVPLLQKEMDT